jgi:hypothetical protein
VQIDELCIYAVHVVESKPLEVDWAQIIFYLSRQNSGDSILTVHFYFVHVKGSIVPYHLQHKWSSFIYTCLNHGISKKKLIWKVPALTACVRAGINCARSHARYLRACWQSICVILCRVSAGHPCERVAWGTFVWTWKNKEILTDAWRRVKHSRQGASHYFAVWSQPPWHDTCNSLVISGRLQPVALLDTWITCHKTQQLLNPTQEYQCIWMLFFQKTPQICHI